MGECDSGFSLGSCNRLLIKIELNCFKIYFWVFVCDVKLGILVKVIKLIYVVVFKLLYR